MIDAHLVIPAQAGIQLPLGAPKFWIPACAGMTRFAGVVCE